MPAWVDHGTQLARNVGERRHLGVNPGQESLLVGRLLPPKDRPESVEPKPTDVRPRDELRGVMLLLLLLLRGRGVSSADGVVPSGGSR